MHIQHIIFLLFHSIVQNCFAMYATLTSFFTHTRIQSLAPAAPTAPITIWQFCTFLLSRQLYCYSAIQTFVYETFSRRTFCLPQLVYTSIQVYTYIVCMHVCVYIGDFRWRLKLNRAANRAKRKQNSNESKVKVRNQLSHTYIHTYSQIFHQVTYREN